MVPGGFTNIANNFCLYGLKMILTLKIRDEINTGGYI